MSGVGQDRPFALPFTIGRISPKPALVTQSQRESKRGGASKAFLSCDRRRRASKSPLKTP